VTRLADRKRSRSRSKEPKDAAEHRLESIAFGLSPAKIAKACSLGAELKSIFKPKKMKNEPLVEPLGKKDEAAEVAPAAIVEPLKVAPVAAVAAVGEIAEVEMTACSPTPTPVSVNHVQL
jgi:hypothetical protein